MSASCNLCNTPAFEDVEPLGLVCAECNKLVCSNCAEPEGLYCKPCSAQQFIDSEPAVKQFIEKNK